ncbi:MAG TPA: redoxin domain-containing protein [Reyranella sp.]|jgi:alkyl hydroperoxide reductase subunit AhpC|nr:redoxin domain-containing protein [Reyranella sp.]
MSLQAGDTAPDFEQDTINGSIRFHEWMGRSWCVLFSQSRPAGNELAQMARLKPEWNRRGVKVVGLAVEPACQADGSAQGGADRDGWALNFPVIADADRSVSALYGVARPEDGTILRSVYVIDPAKKVRMVRTFPPGTVCDFSEMLSMVDCLQLADALGEGGRAVRN